MQDNKSQKADDLNEDTGLEMDDIDAETDFADDSWDEFDDDAKEAAPEKDAAPAPEKKKKKGSSKYLNLIIIIVVMAGGGYFIFGQALNAPVSAPTEDTQAQAPEETAQSGAVELPNGATPPMPAPIDSASETQDISEAAPAPTPAPPVSPEPEALTPVPETQALAAAPAPTPLKADPDTGEIQAEVLPPGAPGAAQPAIPQPIPANNNDAPPQNMQSPVTAAFPMPVAVDAVMAEKVKGLEKNIASLRGDLEGKINDTNQKIDSLTSSIQSLEAKIDDVSNKAAQKTAVATPAPAPVAAAPKKEVTKKTALAPREKKQASATPAATAAPAKATGKTSQWVLRSAQPGKASLSPKGSNEMQSVGIGDKLPGIGRIMSIDLENGTWIVRGTEGSVSR